MIDEKRRPIYLLSLQIISFVMLLIYSIGLDRYLILPTILITIELALLATMRKGLRPFLLLWQGQFFLTAFVGIVIYPSLFLNLASIKESVQIALALIMIFAEILVLIIYRYKERGIIWTLKGYQWSPSSLVVMLVLIVIVSEGLPGFAE